MRPQAPRSPSQRRPIARRTHSPALAALLCAASLAACDADRSRPSPAAAAPPAPSSQASQAPQASSAVTAARFPGAARIVAIGDLHGDLAAAKTALRLAGAIDASDRWAGGALVVVQTGDMLDRGDDERAIIELFERLAEEAPKAGGAVYTLNGNHEIMNVSLDFRYVTEGGFRDFAGVVSALALSDGRLTSLPEEARPRAAAFMPGGPFAKRLAKRNTVAIVGDTVFVHGGLLPAHVRYGVDRINREVSAWMNGDTKSPPSIATAEDSPVWARYYADKPDPGECETLAKTLGAILAKRMVVGHTVQKGINAGCDGGVWRIDVGLAAHYGGPKQVLEIAGDSVRVLREGAAEAPPSSTASPVSSGSPASSASSGRAP